MLHTTDDILNVKNDLCILLNILLKIFPIYSFAPALIRRIVDCGEAMKGTWAIKKRNRCTGVAMKVDAHDRKLSRARSVTKDLRKHF